MWSLLAAYLDMPPYTAPAPTSSDVKIPEGLELAKCGREDCNGYVQVGVAPRVVTCRERTGTQGRSIHHWQSEVGTLFKEWVPG